MASTVLERLQIVISTNEKQFIAQLRGIQKSVNGLTGNLKNLARGVGLTFGAFEAGRVLKDVIRDSVRLATEASGVRKAFDKLNDPGLLTQLQVATKGTINNLELMRSAVEFDNFKLPLDKLGTLLKFIQLRSEQTGKSVDFLRQSLVEGLAKESTLRLDNLGFKVKEIKDAMKKFGDITSAVAFLAQREIKKMGEESVEASTKMNQLVAAADNLKLTIGSIATGPVGKGFTDFLTRVVKGLDQSFSIIFSAPAAQGTPVEQRIKNLTEEIKNLDKLIASDREFSALTPLLGVTSEKSQETANAQLARRQELVKKLIGLLPALGAETEKSNKKSTKSSTEQIGALGRIKKEIADVMKARLAASREELPALKLKLDKLREEERLLQSIKATTRTPADNELFGFNELDTTSLSLEAITEANNIRIDQLNERIGDTNAGSLELQNNLDLLAQRSAMFTSILSQGLHQVLGLLFNVNDKSSKLGRILLNVATGLLGSILTGPGGPVAKLGGGLAKAFGSLFGGSAAEGARVRKPTFMLVGDNPGRDELIIPSEKYGQVFGQGFSGGGMERLVLKTKIQANDLWVILQREEKRLNRMFGGSTNNFQGR